MELQATAPKRKPIRDYLSQYLYLREFFTRSWKSPGYSYRVYFAKKCLNINEIAFDNYVRNCDAAEAEELSRIREKSFLAQGGMLLKGEELTRHYLDHGRFPRILVLDEFTLSGKRFSEFMYSLERIVDTAYERLTHRVLDQYSIMALRADLFSAVDFLSYMGDARGPVLESALLKRMTFKFRKYSADWFPYIQRMSALITNDDKTENTGIIPTFRINSVAYQRLDSYLAVHRTDSGSRWRKTIWHENGTELTFYQSSHYSAPNTVNAHFALRCRPDVTSEKYYITPYVFWNNFYDLHDRAYQDFFTVVASYCADNGLSYLSEVFSSPYQTLASVKLQLFTSIGSILLFMAILNESGTGIGSEDKILLNSDLAKVSQNFGTIQEMMPQFKRLCGNKATSVRIRKWFLKQYKRILFTKTKPLGYGIGNNPDHTLGEYYRMAKRCYLLVELQELETQRTRRKNKILYAPWSHYVDESVGISAYLNNFPDEYSCLDHKVAALLVMCQQGKGGLCIYPQEKDVVYLKTGEATFSLAYEPLFAYLPALVKLEKYCREHGLDLLNWAVFFGGYLEHKVDNGRPVAELFRKYIKIIYDNGFLLSDWPQELTESEDDRENQELYMQAVNKLISAL